MKKNSTTKSAARKYKPYPAYKDSGVEWLGEIPEGWEVKKATYIYSIGSGTTPKSENPDYYGDGLPWVTTSELRESRITETEKSVTESAIRDYSSLKVYPSGSLIIAMYGATIGRIGLLDIPATVNQACCVFFNGEHIERMFMFYWLQMRRDYLISLGFGGGQPNLSQDLLRSMRIPLPGMNEQRAVVVYLDRETSKIDALLAKYARLLELLAEKRSALISCAVTKGLDPDAPMKDSGVEWLGEIPEGWAILPFKAAVGFIEGPGIMADDFRDEGVPLLRIASIVGPFARLEGCNYLDPEKVKQKWDHFRVLNGDLLISASASTGYCSEVDNDVVGAIPYTGIITMRPDSTKVMNAYLKWFLVSDAYQIQVENVKSGSAMQHYGPTHLSAMFIVLPEIKQQNAIVEYLGRKTTKLDALAAKVERAVELLKEYRVALISAAVTGKIDLRRADE